VLCKAQVSLLVLEPRHSLLLAWLMAPVLGQALCWLLLRLVSSTQSFPVSILSDCFWSTHRQAHFAGGLVGGRLSHLEQLGKTDFEVATGDCEHAFVAGLAD